MLPIIALPSIFMSKNKKKIKKSKDSPEISSTQKTSMHVKNHQSKKRTKKKKRQKKNTKLNTKKYWVCTYMLKKLSIAFLKGHRSLVRSISSSPCRPHIIPVIVSASAIRSTKGGVPYLRSAKEERIKGIHRRG